MLKKTIIRRFSISLIIIFLISITCTLGINNKEDKENIVYVSTQKSNIFVLDNNDYVAKTKIVTKSIETLDKIKEIIDSLTIDSNKSDYIKEGFSPIIPKNTKIIDLSLDNNVLKINFSKELLNIDLKYEEKLIEVLTYNLTEFKEIDAVMLYVEGSILNKLPNSKKIIPTPLTRDIGINKIYNLSDLKNTSKTTIYYLASNKDYYYIPITKITNDSLEKVEIIVNSLKSTPINSTNLISYLSYSTKLLDYEINENVLTLNFNSFIYSGIDKNEIEEEVKYTLLNSIKENYKDITNVIINVDNKYVDNTDLKNLE